ncbi:MAG: NfeD family protein [Gammaproteobacteria bacterium]|nr:NfeD family protein [Gammaproteobacteria bacterium]
MPASTFWFILALVLLGLEMASGTFYLLVLAIAAALGGVTALSGLDVLAQSSSAAFAAVVGALFLRHWKTARTPPNNDQNLDIGHTVTVVTWRDDGTLRVHYRGAEWEAETDTPNVSRQSTLYIKALRGSTLILSDSKPLKL